MKMDGDKVRDSIDRADRRGPPGADAIDNDIVGCEDPLRSLDSRRTGERIAESERKLTSGGIRTRASPGAYSMRLNGGRPVQPSNATTNSSTFEKPQSWAISAELSPESAKRRGASSRRAASRTFP